MQHEVANKVKLPLFSALYKAYCFKTVINREIKISDANRIQFSFKDRDNRQSSHFSAQVNLVLI